MARHATFARAYCGHLFDAKNPGQLWDVYVSCRFQEEQCFTDRFVLVKVKPEDKPVALHYEEKTPPPAFIADLVAEANGKADAVAWDQIRAVAPWKEALNGKNTASSPELKIAFDSKYLYLRYAEKNSIHTPGKDFWNNCTEIFLYGDALYPLLQIGIAPDGQALCNTYDIRKSSNDTADQVTSEKTVCPGVFQGKTDGNTRTWEAALPLDKLPVFRKGALHVNFYRTYPNGNPALAWSPVYEESYRNALNRFGTIYPGRMVLSGDQILCKQRTPEGIAFMDGNHGWEITARPPKGLDPSAAYRISAELRCDAPPVEGKFMTRAGAYDEKTKKITGYVGIDVSRIRGETFHRIPFDKPVKLTEDTFLYVGGFIPTKVHQGNVYLKSFILEKAE
ncbi:MAG: hypothetical protein BWY31_03193 [Lentisphaerae bacterium ADurb.Bin242]|nr:MAG: hypothetical protein BWY31_03193 [Lentisphaerae bacterium ADurb.Bin242]